MKTSLKTLLAGILTLGVMSSAAFAEDFVIDNAKYQQHKAEMKAQMRTEPVSRYQKGRFSGSSAYNGNLSGRVAVQTDTIGDMDGRAFTVHPIRGTANEFNANLRYGDTSQSRETKFSHAFNN